MSAMCIAFYTACKVILYAVLTATLHIQTSCRGSAAYLLLGVPLMYLTAQGMAAYLHG
jgi:hypothetical protein